LGDELAERRGDLSRRPDPSSERPVEATEITMEMSERR
jgi:hypothetical protein